MRRNGGIQSDVEEHDTFSYSDRGDRRRPAWRHRPRFGAQATASCAGTPVTSTHVFTSTVTAVRNQGRTATVRTDDGRSVMVLGSEASQPNATTSVDRTFDVGVRHEFHPIDDGAPYRDNACTATHAIGAAGSDGTSAAHKTGNAPLVLPWIGAGVALLGAAIAVWYVRRRGQLSVQPAGGAASLSRPC